MAGEDVAAQRQAAQGNVKQRAALEAVLLGADDQLDRSQQQRQPGGSGDDHGEHHAHHHEATQHESDARDERTQPVDVDDATKDVGKQSG